MREITLLTVAHRKFMNQVLIFFLGKFLFVVVEYGGPPIDLNGHCVMCHFFFSGTVGKLPKWTTPFRKF